MTQNNACLPCDISRNSLAECVHQAKLPAHLGQAIVQDDTRSKTEGTSLFDIYLQISSTKQHKSIERPASANQANRRALRCLGILYADQAVKYSHHIQARQPEQSVCIHFDPHLLVACLLIHQCNSKHTLDPDLDIVECGMTISIAVNP